MKHVIIPIVALIVVLGVGIFESISVFKTFKKFEDNVDDLIELCDQNALTMDIYDDFYEKWLKVREKSEFFLPHNDVYEITLRVGEIRAYVEQQDFELCQANLFVIKELASYVSHLAIPSLGHVF